MSLDLQSARVTSRAVRSASAAPSRPAKSRDSRNSWTAYLTSLDGPLAAEHAKYVTRFWRRLQSWLRGECPVPQAGPTETPGLLLVWDRQHHHLEVEVFEDGTYDWFYRDRKIESCHGGEGLDTDARPQDLLAHLRLLCNGSP